MSRKIKFLKRIRSTLLSMREKSNDRIITDCTLVRPLVNDKGMNVVSDSKTRKRSSNYSRQFQIKRSSIYKK